MFMFVLYVAMYVCFTFVLRLLMFIYVCLFIYVCFVCCYVCLFFILPGIVFKFEICCGNLHVFAHAKQMNEF